MQSLLILGRQPSLGLSELESLYGHDKIRPIGRIAALLDIDPCLLAFKRLGGSVKFCKVLTTLPTTEWSAIEKFLLKVAPDHSRAMPEGKMRLGLSVYNLNVSLSKLESTGLTLKKVIRKTGRSVRLIPNKTHDLNSAQIIHNNLTGPNGWDLIFIKDENQTIIAQTVMVQDIEGYTKRDRERPKRDAKVGMLPPKLAQIILNLASGLLDSEKEMQSICDIPETQLAPAIINKTVLDPFCGTGVILQEAALVGYNTYGTDYEERMVQYSIANLEWLKQRHSINEQITVEVGDAITYHWKHTVDFIASETYLGRAFTEKPDQAILNQTIHECNLIIKKFLNNIYTQIKPQTRLCLAVPAWQISLGNFKHLPLIDQLDELGYNRISFTHVYSDQLIYYRPDQIVGRELLILTKK